MFSLSEICYGVLLPKKANQKIIWLQLVFFSHNIQPKLVCFAFLPQGRDQPFMGIIWVQLFWTDMKPISKVSADTNLKKFKYKWLCDIIYWTGCPFMVVSFSVSPPQFVGGKSDHNSSST